MLWVFLAYELSRQLRLFLQLFFLRFIMGRVRVNIFWGNLRPVVGKLVSSTFSKKRSDPLAISLNIFTRFSYTLLFILMKTAELLFFLAIYLDITESNQGRNLKWELYVRNIIGVIFCKRPETSGLYTSVLARETIILCITLVSKER